jgi:hypothetical protein
MWRSHGSLNIFFHEEYEGELFQIEGGCIWKRKNPLFLRFNLFKGIMEKIDCVQVPIEPNFRLILQSIFEVTQPPTHLLTFEQETKFPTWWLIEQQ